MARVAQDLPIGVGPLARSCPIFGNRVGLRLVEYAVRALSAHTLARRARVQSSAAKRSALIAIASCGVTDS